MNWAGGKVGKMGGRRDCLRNRIVRVGLRRGRGRGRMRGSEKAVQGSYSEWGEW